MEIQDSRFKIQHLNEKGIALVLVLILSMISLAIVSAMLFMITQGTVISGAQRFYSTAEVASTGAVELSTIYLSTQGTFNLVGVGITQRCNCGDPTVTTDNIDLNVTPNARTCRCDKLCNSKNNWAFGTETYTCRDNPAVATLSVSLDPTKRPDFSFDLGNFRLYTKVVDTVQGNSDLGSIVTSSELGGSAVSSGAAGIVTPPHSPYLYRMEVQAEAINNPRELSRISVLYAH